MSEKFEREERYIVFKVKDLSEHKLGWVRDVIRLNDIPTVDAVVVEADWPEYEPTWAAIERRVTGAQWNGEGLPPVGQKIEMKNKRSTEEWARPGFQEVTITAMGTQLFLVTYSDGGDENCGHLSEYDFRPLSSPEQKAAEERQRAARQMCLDAGHESPTPGQISMGLKLFDAGYRKQVAP
ncbi:MULTISPECIES: hypothetical protein [Pseudomonas]|uniref:hypothetical protein n=1 Tax=Pseudomonas TaxID=286 RepID=UPI0002173505|nr:MULTISPECIES: hypothetical protein [Pseudomonas]AEJ12998.1 hypothetical protein PPS_2439 [Pseudomonas putida S16]WOB61274.1 hypothetical protein NY023_12755 [Pseudomonas sp. NBB]